MSEKATMLDKNWFAITQRVTSLDAMYFASDSVPLKEVRKLRELIDYYLALEERR